MKPRNKESDEKKIYKKIFHNQFSYVRVVAEESIRYSGYKRGKLININGDII